MSMKKLFKWESSDPLKIKTCFLEDPKLRMQKGIKIKEKKKFDPPKQKEKYRQLDEPSGSRKNKQKGKENIRCSYYGRGFHPESSCMKRTIYQMDLLLEKDNINLLEGARKKDNQDRNNQPERGHALMENVLKPRYILIDSDASSHMVSCK